MKLGGIFDHLEKDPVWLEWSTLHDQWVKKEEEEKKVATVSWPEFLMTFQSRHPDWFGRDVKLRASGE